MKYKKVISPEVASEEYIQLEREHKELGEYVKKVKSKVQKEMVRRKRKSIRERQNYLYTQISGSGYLKEIAETIGVGYSALYRRTVRKK